MLQVSRRQAPALVLRVETGRRRVVQHGDDGVNGGAYWSFMAVRRCGGTYGENAFLVAQIPDADGSQLVGGGQQRRGPGGKVIGKRGGRGGGGG